MKVAHLVGLPFAGHLFSALRDKEAGESVFLLCEHALIASTSSCNGMKWPLVQHGR